MTCPPSSTPCGSASDERTRPGRLGDRSVGCRWSVGGAPGQTSAGPVVPVPVTTAAAAAAGGHQRRGLPVGDAHRGGGMSNVKIRILVLGPRE